MSHHNMNIKKICSAKSPIYRAFLLPRCRDFKLHIRRYKTVVFTFRMHLNSRTTEYLQKRQTGHQKLACRFLLPSARSFAKDFGLFSFHNKGAIKMYFTNTPSLNRMETMMIRPPGGVQRDGGKNRSPYKYTKKTATADFAFTTEKRAAALSRYALY